MISTWGQYIWMLYDIHDILCELDIYNSLTHTLYSTSKPYKILRVGQSKHSLCESKVHQVQTPQRTSRLGPDKKIKIGLKLEVLI